MEIKTKYDVGQEFVVVGDGFLCFIPTVVDIDRITVEVSGKNKL